jgi:hypothetical protein
MALVWRTGLGAGCCSSATKRTARKLLGGQEGLHQLGGMVGEYGGLLLYGSWMGE